MSENNDNNEQHNEPTQQSQNLEFQSFNDDETPADTSIPIEDQPVPGDESEYQSPLLYENNNSNNNDNNFATREDTSKQSVWSLHYIITRFGAHRYFDVDTNQVLDRVVRALLPFRLSFLDAVKDNPDLYGPFWITTTLVVVLSVAANLGSYLDFLSASHSSTNTAAANLDTTLASPFSGSGSSHSNSGGGSHTGSGSDASGNGSAGSVEWAMNFHYVTVSAGTIYGYMILAPLLVWGVLRWRSVKVSLLQTIALFGYSLAALVPTTALCVVPLWYLRLAFILIGLSDASAFLILNLVPVFRKSPGLLAPGVGFVLLTHAALGVAFMLYFFV